jgi:hypothetical protein
MPACWIEGGASEQGGYGRVSSQRHPRRQPAACFLEHFLPGSWGWIAARAAIRAGLKSVEALSL